MFINGSKLLGCPVLSLHVGGKIAQVTSPIIDPNNLKIIAYKISWKSEKTGNWVKDKYKSKDKYKHNQNLPQGLPSWTDEAKLLKAGYDTKGMTQNEMYHLVKEKGL